MRSGVWISRLYALDVALFIAHEIDSAVWHEWALFHIGDENFFVLVHLPLVIALLWGQAELALGRPWGDRMAGFIAFAGVAAFFIHASFLAAGTPEFRTPVSLGVIGAMAVVSVALGVLVAPRLVRR